MQRFSKRLSGLVVPAELPAHERRYEALEIRDDVARKRIASMLQSVVNTADFNPGVTVPPELRRVADARLKMLLHFGRMLLGENWDVEINT